MKNLSMLGVLLMSVGAQAQTCKDIYRQILKDYTNCINSKNFENCARKFGKVSSHKALTRIYRIQSAANDIYPEVLDETIVLGEIERKVGEVVSIKEFKEVSKKYHYGYLNNMFHFFYDPPWLRKDPVLKLFKLIQKRYDAYHEIFIDASREHIAWDQVMLAKDGLTFGEVIKTLNYIEEKGILCTRYEPIDLNVEYLAEIVLKYYFQAGIYKYENDE